jgi:multimeric flavodoxin WrbA
LLCNQFILRTKKAGNPAEKIFLRDKEINYYLACDTCKRNGNDYEQDDDLVEVLDKMIATDIM